MKKKTVANMAEAAEKMEDAIKEEEGWVNGYYI